MGTSSGTQSVQSQTNTQPWQPAQPELKSILSNTAGLNPNVTPQESAAIQQLQANTGGISNFGPSVQNTAASYLGGDPYNLINNAYSGLRGSLGGLTNPNNLNPYNTPGFSQALNTLNQDITNQIQGGFAAAGRTGSGQDTQTLARGLSQGEGGLLANQYNQNVQNLINAGSQLFGSGINTNQALSGNVGQGVGLAGAVPGLAVQGPAAGLTAAQAPFNLASGNLGILGGIADPIAALGGQSNTNQTGSFSNSLSPFQMAAGGLGLFGGQYSPISGLTGFLSKI